MICPACGLANADDDRFCSRCRAPLPGGVPAEGGGADGDMPADARRTLLNGRFNVIKQLGKGGMGEILLAEDVKLGRKVAIKSISADALSDCDSKTRFLREAQAASRLEHPNICTIYEIAEEGEREYIVMQFIDGVTLDQLMKMKPLSLSQVVDIASQIAAAMAAAQARGIVHRDIKPGNIMLDRDGQVKILDFGLAKICRPGDDGVEDERRERDLTEKGIVLGTVSYMSPEQARGMKLDSRSDIFSFGVVLYEMIENRNPFSDGENIVTLYNILHREVAFLRAAPEPLRDIARRALQKDRGRRYDDFDDIRRDLAALKPVLAGFHAAGRPNETEVIDSRSQQQLLQAVEGARQSSDGEHLSELVRRLKRMKASTEALRTSRARRWRPLAAAGLLLAAAGLLGVLFLRPPREGKRPAPPPVHVLLYPFENQTPDPRLAQEVHFLVQEALNQFAEFKALDEAAVRELAGGRDITPESLPKLREKFGIRYVLKGKLSHVADKFNIEASLGRVGVREDHAPFFIPGKEKNSLLTDQVDNLARRVFQAIGGEPEERSEPVKLSAMYGGDWRAFDLFYRGLLQWNRRQFGPARQLLLNADSLAGGVPAARFYLAQLADYTGAAGDALDHLQGIAPLLPQFSLPLRLRVRALKAKFDFDFPEQVRCLRQLREMFPFSKEKIFDLGEAYFRRGDAARAIPEYDAALALDRNYAAALNHLGYCYSYQGRHREAIECFERYRDIDRTANSFDSLGDGYFYLGDYTQAENSKIYAVSLDNSMDWPYLTIADIHVLRADFREAAKSLAAYRRLASYPKAHADALAKEAYMRYLEGDPAAALDLLGQALARHDSRSITDHSAECHWLRGLCLLAGKDIPGAIVELRWLQTLCGAYRLSSDNYDPALKFRLHLEARIAEEMDRPQAAREAYASLLAMQTQLSFWITYYSYPFFLNEYAGFLLRRNDLDAAGEAIDRCLAFNPDYTPALWSQAELLKARGDGRRRQALERIAAVYGPGDADNFLRRRLADGLR